MGHESVRNPVTVARPSPGIYTSCIIRLINYNEKSNHSYGGGGAPYDPPVLYSQRLIPPLDEDFINRPNTKLITKSATDESWFDRLGSPGRCNSGTSKCVK